MGTYCRTAVDPRFVTFLARNDFRCPGCGYKLMGLKTTRCPDCAYRIDVAATLAAYRGPGVVEFVRSRVGLGITLLLNIGLLVGIHAGVPALAATQYSGKPPLEYYGLLTIRLAWFTVMLLGVGAWAVQLVSTALHGEDERRVAAAGCWLAIGGTLLHVAWAALRVALA